MTLPDIDRWDPLAVDEAADLFTDAPFRWWIAGGYALELNTGRSWRDHDDIDIGVCGFDVELLRRHLAEWDIHIAAEGTLTPWDGEALDPTKSQNNLWCREALEDPWRMDVPIGDGETAEWVYRRDRTIRLPWSEAVLTTKNGVPYLAPDVALLFKSKILRPKDTIDASEVIPGLASSARGRLQNWLATDHPWQPSLQESQPETPQHREESA